MSDKKKYTHAQRKAYYSGMGYRVAYEGRGISFKSAERRKSFQEGYSSIRDKLDRYPKLPLKKKG